MAHDPPSMSPLPAAVSLCDLFYALTHMPNIFHVVDNSRVWWMWLNHSHASNVTFCSFDHSRRPDHSQDMDSGHFLSQGTAGTISCLPWAWPLIMTLKNNASFLVTLKGSQGDFTNPPSSLSCWLATLLVFLSHLVQNWLIWVLQY